jgi:hypothetical protein
VTASTNHFGFCTSMCTTIYTTIRASCVVCVCTLATGFAHAANATTQAMHDGMAAAHHGSHNSANNTNGDPHSAMGHHKHGAMQHDEVNMPGLRGKDTTEAEVGDMRAMFQQHTAIERTVTNLPNGIRTVTQTDDAQLRPKLVGHVVSMLARMQSKRNPEVIIQSPTLNPLFARGDEIQTTIEMSPTGVIVTQTAADPQLVALLQTHAAEVSDLAKRGMQAVHEQMGPNHHR